MIKLSISEMIWGLTYATLKFVIKQAYRNKVSGSFRIVCCGKVTKSAFEATTSLTTSPSCSLACFYLFAISNVAESLYCENRHFYSFVFKLRVDTFSLMRLLVKIFMSQPSKHWVFAALFALILANIEFCIHLVMKIIFENVSVNILSLSLKCKR